MPVMAISHYVMISIGREFDPDTDAGYQVTGSFGYH